MNMTRFLKGPFDVAAVLVLLSVPIAAQATAQESGAQDTGSEGIATVARSGSLQIGGVEVSAGGPDRPIAACRITFCWTTPVGKRGGGPSTCSTSELFALR